MQGLGQIKILARKVDYSCPPMDIIRLEVEDTKGKKRPYWMLDRKNNFSIVIPLFPDNTTMLVGQFRVPINAYSWEFAMGTVVGATPLGTAEQELREETGLTAKKMEMIGEFFLGPGISSQVGHVFLARELTIGSPTPEEDEDLVSKRVSITDLREMISTGKVKDGPTLIAWQFLQKYL